tara:strand:+ start:6668 stop:7651 length:984 start_codon:yes stop_codon:yes gene_type:complete
MRIHCLGGGLVGSYVTNRLVAAQYEVHLFDVIERDTRAVFHHCDAFSADHSSADIIVNMLPGSLGHKMTEMLKNTGQKIVDLSFSEHTPNELTDVSSSILWDVGIAPGLSNMLVALALREYGNLDDVSIKVGGNPSQPDCGWSYMAPFSPHDVIAEYTRPARIIQNSERIDVPAMSELHKINANGRNMEAFLTDGLRSLLDVPAKNMGEYTVRWPGHIEKYQQSNLSADELVEAWKMDESKSEFTWMQVSIKSGEKSTKWIIEDSGKDGDSSMARTTGLVTACCVLAWIERPQMLAPGVFAPEDLPSEVIWSVIDIMRAEGVLIEQQ